MLAGRENCSHTAGRWAWIFPIPGTTVGSAPERTVLPVLFLHTGAGYRRTRGALTMAVAPDPSEIFQRAVKEGERRLNQSLLELVSTSFIAGFTIIFGIIALGIAHSAVEPHLGEFARVAGALAFAIGLVFLVVGRAELFTENFSDPVAAVWQQRGSGSLRRLLRLWGVTFVLNLVGGALLALAAAVPGVLPGGAGDSLGRIAEEVAGRGFPAVFVSAIIGGALVALLSFLLQAVNSVGSRITMAYFVGFILAAGPFDHVVVTVLHVVIGMLLGAPIGLETLAVLAATATAGNLVGGLGLVTLSHIARDRGAEESGSEG